MMKNGNTMMGAQIINQDDFLLKYFKNSDIYFLFYKNSPIWDGEFNELFDVILIDYVFDYESDPKKATKFISELHKWGLMQQRTFKKLLDTVYGKKV